MVEETCEVLDYSKKGLKKIDKASDQEAKCVSALILDDNEIQRLDYVDSYIRLETLSIAKNHLLRMHGVSRLVCLRELNLNNNSVLTIEGLKELVHLRKLHLAGNNIKSIEHLNNNTNLEYLDLSDNQISHISDISFLKNLKAFYLDKNRIGNLRQCEKYVPSSLTAFGLANNFLTDLNTLCHLSHLEYLENFNIDGNPCVAHNDHEKINFDYRPFVINWVMNVKILDGYEVNAIESLKAEWLYSQGRGRQFREGEHNQLIQYLSMTCPLGDAAPETEEQRKLHLILSKAQHHQQQLREQSSSPSRTKHSPRIHARITGRVTKSPDCAMSSSYHSALSNKHYIAINEQSNQMSTSFSGEIPLNSTHPKPNKTESHTAPITNYGSDASYNPTDAKKCKIEETKSSIKEKHDKSEKEERKSENFGYGKKATVGNKPTEANLDLNKIANQPLEAASKMVPIPDSMMSPDYYGPVFVSQTTTITTTEKKNLTPSSHQTNSLPLHHHKVITNQSTNSTRSPQSEAIKSGKIGSRSTIHVAKPVAQNIKSNKGSPQMPRSAMSSPKMRHCVERRKGSFSSKSLPSNCEESNSTSNVKSKDFPNSHNREIDKCPNTVNDTSSQVTVSKTKDMNSSDDDSEMCVEKLQSIREAAIQRRKKQSISDSGSSENVMFTNKSSTSKSKLAYDAAVTIQKLWRGYRTRNLNQKTCNIMHSIQTMRTRQYMEKLSSDMEATKTALDNERKIQQLQMHAINALWKKISTMEDDCKSKEISVENNKKQNEGKMDEIFSKDLAVRELTQTCNMLQAQVQQLQGSMRDILQLFSKNKQIMDLSGGIATQTEITAVHTPQGEGAMCWPYQKTHIRPCSLSLSVQNSNFQQSHSVNNEIILENEAENSNLPGQAVPEDVLVENTVNSSQVEEIPKNISTKPCELTNQLEKDCLGK